jgi:serine/threonine protein kinase
MKQTNKKTRKQRRRKYVVGGKALTSGGFGCLFRPVLKCKNTLNYDKIQGQNQSHMVTKLMTKKHAKDEYKQISEFKSILDHIPNYQNYFLVDGFSICEPAELSKDDLEDFDDKCSALKKKHFKESNINQNLDKILALNMPDGGIDVDDYILNVANKSSIVETYSDLNTTLVDLLVNGIDPMNQSKLYHCDVKGSNILVSKADGPDTIARLIDWGLSINKTATIKNTVPDKLERRPFQFNVPFSVILFNKKFIEKYDRFLKRHNPVDYFAIREFVINYIFYWNKIRGAGHLKTINAIMKRLTYDELPAIENKQIKNHVIEYDFTYYYIVEYISKILLKYTVDGKLNLLDYFNNVFLKNIDVWGLTMIYMIFLDHLYEENEQLNIYHMQFVDKIKYIIIHFLFENPTEVININKLAAELQALNGLIAKFDILSNKPNKPNKRVDEKVDYLLSLTKIEADDIKEIGGELIRPSKGNQTNKIRKGVTNRSKGRSSRRL